MESQVVQLTVCVNTEAAEWLRNPNWQLVKKLRAIANFLEASKGDMNMAQYMYDYNDESCGLWSLYVNPPFYKQ